MKKIYLIFSLLIIFQVQSRAQTEQFSMQKLHYGVIDYAAGYKPICVANQTIASILPQKYVAMFPEQKGGPMKVMQYDVINMSFWELDFKGTIYPYGMIYNNDNYYIVGAYTDSIHVNGTSYYGIDSFRLSSFVVSINYNGQLNWIKTVTDSIWNSMANSITALPSGNLLVSSLYQDVESVVWKINPSNGNTMSTKYFPQVRTISDIKFDHNNHLYFAGSTFDNAFIDTFRIINPMNNGYVNYMVKADTNLNVLKLYADPYITFDFTSKLLPHRGGVLWSHYRNDQVNSIMQTLSYFNQNGNFYFGHNFRTDFNLADYENQLTFSKYYDGDFIFLKKINKDYYMFNLSNNNRDSVKISSDSKFKIYTLESYFGGLTLVGSFEAETLYYLNNQLHNPFYSINKSVMLLSVFGNNNSYVNNSNTTENMIYPNPVEEQLYFKHNNIECAELYDLAGRLINTYHQPKTINCKELQSGFYIMRLKTSDGINQKMFIKK